MELTCGFDKNGKSWVSLTSLFFKANIIQIDELRYYFKQIFNKFDYFYLLLNHESVEISWVHDNIKYVKLRDMLREFNIQDQFVLIDAELNEGNIKNLLVENYISGFIPRDIFKYTSNSIKKHFVCHNNVAKIHRDYIVDFIKNNNIENKVFLSYHRSSSDFNNDWEKIGQVSQITEEYVSSFCNIVTETYFQESTDLVFTFTEKLMKPIVAEIPFILAAQPKSLEKLREIGFKTFSNWWDESYDLEMDTDIRLNKICEIILEISNWSLDRCISTYNEMNDVLSHNSRLYKKLYKDYSWLYDTKSIILKEI